MAYGKNFIEAQERVKIKRELRRKGITDFENDDDFDILKEKLG